MLPFPNPIHKCSLFLFMACGSTKWWTIFTILVVLNVKVEGEPQVPCYFIFGDSLVDNGNNNNLETVAKVNHLPYGIDFPGGPTGRFTNGRTIADLIGELLGFNGYIPPFASAKENEIVMGVNYGSGGAGILDESGRQLGYVNSLNKQLSNHQQTVSKIAKLKGNEDAAKQHLSKCLYTVGMGSNDYINNYLVPEKYESRSKYSPDQFAGVLIQQYSQQLRNLYDLGARRIAVFGVGLIGCTPAVMKMEGKNDGCVDSVINAVQLFNNKLEPLIDTLNKDLKDAKFTLVNIAGISAGDPASLGITDTNSPCCEVLKTNADKGQCVLGKTPCGNRNQHAFYDDFHPTEIVNKVLASRAYNAILSTDSHPYDIRHLVQL